MLAILKRLKKEEKGFTLIELLAVIVILAVIAVIAVPLIGNIISKTKEDADIATARQVYNAARLYVISELDGNFSSKTINIIGTTTTLPSGASAGAATDTRGLQIMGYLESDVVIPSTKLEITGGTIVFNSSGALDSLTLITGSGTVATTAEKANANGKSFSAEHVMKGSK